MSNAQKPSKIKMRGDTEISDVKVGGVGEGAGKGLGQMMGASPEELGQRSGLSGTALPTGLELGTGQWPKGAERGQWS